MCKLDDGNLPLFIEEGKNDILNNKKTNNQRDGICKTYMFIPCYIVLLVSANVCQAFDPIHKSKPDLYCYEHTSVG